MENLTDKKIDLAIKQTSELVYALNENGLPVNFVIEKMSEWVRILNENGHGSPTGADVDHSALLRRLLEGKEAFKNPPPKMFAYPNYKLAEGKEVEIYEINDYNDEVLIDQYHKWKWLDKEKGVLEHMPDGDLYQYWEEERERNKITRQEGKTKVKYTAKLLKKIPETKFPVQFAHNVSNFYEKLEQLEQKDGKNKQG